MFHGNYRDFAGCHQLLSLDLAQNQIATISGNFQGLRGLTKINLIGNDIVCIDRYISHLVIITEVIKQGKKLVLSDALAVQSQGPNVSNPKVVLRSRKML